MPNGKNWWEKRARTGRGEWLPFAWMGRELFKPRRFDIPGLYHDPSEAWWKPRMRFGAEQPAGVIPQRQPLEMWPRGIPTEPEAREEWRTQWEAGIKATEGPTREWTINRIQEAQRVRDSIMGYANALGQVVDIRNLDALVMGAIKGSREDMGELQNMLSNAKQAYDIKYRTKGLTEYQRLHGVGGIADWEKAMGPYEAARAAREPGETWGEAYAAARERQMDYYDIPREDEKPGELWGEPTEAMIPGEPPRGGGPGGGVVYTGPGISSYPQYQLGSAMSLWYPGLRTSFLAAMQKQYPRYGGNLPPAITNMAKFGVWLETDEAKELLVAEETGRLKTYPDIYPMYQAYREKHQWKADPFEEWLKTSPEARIVMEEKEKEKTRAALPRETRRPRWAVR